MATSKSRQRKLAREKYQRQMVRRAQRQRRQRRVRAGISAVVTLAVIALGTAWLAGAFEPEPEEYVADRCTWITLDAATNPDRIEAGTPDPNPPTEGTRTMTVELTAGDAGSGSVEAVLDVGVAPCAVASLQYLAEHDFYDDTTCHELFEGAALRCGDPRGTGLGGPTFAYYAENVPSVPLDPTPSASASADAEDGDGEDSDSAEGAQDEEETASTVTYQRGTIAVGDPSGQHGSQFLLFFDDYTTDAPLFSVVGTITEGLDLLEAIGEAGLAPPEDGEADEEVATGAPAQEVRVTDVTVVDPDVTSEAPSSEAPASEAPASPEASLAPES